MSRVVVLGGGPGGDVAALRAAQLGASVTLIEEDHVGGTCLNWGCIPTKALLAGADLLRRIHRAKEFGIEVEGVKVNFPKMMERKEEIVQKLRHDVEEACSRRHIDLRASHGVLVQGGVEVDGDLVAYDDLILATGTRPTPLPVFDMQHPRVITSDDALRLDVLPERLLIIGGGVIGCEFASLFTALGVAVTVVELLPELLPGVDSRVASFFRGLMGREGVVFHLGRSVSSVVSYRKDGLAVKLDDGTTIDTDYALVAVGRSPRTSGIGLEDAGVVLGPRGHVQVDPFLRTGAAGIWAVGDCIGGQQLAHLASAEGTRAAENALGHAVRAMDRTVVPATIYTHPEIATVGITPDLARSSGIKAKSSRARFSINGKALGEGEADGYAQLLFEEDSHRLLGATIIGPHAVETIHEIAVAMSDALTAGDLGSVIHAHPTVSELIMDAAQQADAVAPYLS